MRIRLALISCLIALAATELASGAQRAEPDAVYFDGRIYTADDALGRQSAFAVRGEHIVAVGSDTDVLALAGNKTRRIDLHAAAVIPGMVDSHDHFWNVGKYLVRGVDLVGVGTFAELEKRLRAAVAHAQPGEVIYTTLGWAVMPDPTRADLDAISADVPIVLVRSRRGLGLLNGAALRRLGVTREHPVFQGQRVPVDSKGEPTGGPILYPHSVDMMDALLPPLSPQQQEMVVEQAMRERNALGITSVRELSAWPEEVGVLQKMRREGKLTLRIALGQEFPAEQDLVAFLAKQPPLDHSDPWLSYDSFSEEPWAPGAVSAEEYTRLVRMLNQRGWRPAPHVDADWRRGTSADAALDTALSAYEAANRDSPILGKRWVVEHVPYATPAQMQRMAALGVIASVQAPGYYPPSPAPLPPERMAHQNPIRGFLDHKVVVIGGSDYNGPNPIDRTPNNPLIPFYFYVTRRTSTGEIRTPDERISREQALRIFTANFAYATFQESMKGRIVSGLLADFVILNQDLMSVPEDRILATRPLATFVGGKKVYAAGSGF